MIVRLLPLACLFACNPGPGPGPWDEGVYLKPGKTAHGDASRGEDLLLNGDYMTCGIPYALWESGDDVIAGALGGESGAPRIAGRTGLNADMPYDLNAFTTPDGVEVINTNCLGCHGGFANGELVVGLGNATVDFTGDPSATGGVVDAGLLAAFGLDDAEIAQFMDMNDRFEAVSDFAVMRTVGNNPAEGLAVALMLHHDPETLEWSDDRLDAFEIVDQDGKPIAEPIITSDAPPWWRAKKKNALFYNGMARGDQRGTMALATSICVDSVDRAMEVDAQFVDIHAYVLTLTAPVWPWKVDDKLAKDGRKIFERDCSGCHGTYAEDPTNDAEDTYPNLLFPLDVIGTDPVVANAGVVHAPKMVEWYNDSFYGSITPMIPDDPFPGYMAPPLDGIWATAPYLHNGSVPSIELVLDSGRRPDRWKRVDFDSSNLDKSALGWPWEPVEMAQDELPPEEARLVYDTAHLSQDNSGHPFGDHLEPDERRAVIEYLKTL